MQDFTNHEYEAELQQLRNLAAKVSKDPELAKRLLMEAGIIDEEGSLTPPFRSTT